MAKYIRTKDGIIYVGDLIKDDYGNYCDPKNYETDIEVSNEYIIKEADTIEELCDEFMVMENNYCIEMYSNYNNLKNSGWYKSYYNIYGAIWTDTGLIYVAKMNDKGELKLI